jgi:hypothetical protein
MNEDKKMRKRILVVLSIVFVFGLVGAVFALSGATATAEKTASSCCPMHKRNAASASTEKSDSCCGMADCCKDGKCSMGGDCCKDKDSCPIKKSQETSSAQSMDMSKVVVATSGGDDCCKPGADCCKGSACCHKKS